MNWIIMGLGVVLLLSLLRLWRCERQLKDWAEQLEETDENSNLRLGTSVRLSLIHICIGLTVIGDGSYARTAAVLRTEPDPAYFFHFPVKFK